MVGRGSRSFFGDSFLSASPDKQAECPNCGHLWSVPSSLFPFSMNCPDCQCFVYVPDPFDANAHDETREEECPKSK